MKTILLAATLVAGTAATPAFACASCGCTLTSDWLSQGLVSQPGTTVALRYDDVPQTELRTEGHAVSDAGTALPADREIERYTYNHYVTASVDHQFTSDWGVNVQIPFVYRPHETFGEDETDPSFSHTAGIGDVRITARWQGFETPGCITGVQVGVILPTGRFRQRFRSGPEAGEIVDRGLQPGTGTIQAVAGAYLFGKLSADFDYILQVQGQVPLDSRDLYRPGAAIQFSAGTHFTRWRGITPQLEVNFRASGKDSGVNSDRDNSGGEQLYIAPGAIVGVGARASLFGYVQVPIYERVNGYQLVPEYTATVGVQFRL